MAGLAEIARAAGVSVSTVSRVLNRRAGVNDETRQRVLAVLAEMPYTPRGLGALQRTGVVGLLVPELSNPVFPAFAEALETRASRLGYASLLCNTRSASMREEEYVRMLLARGVEGMVFVSPEITNTGGEDVHGYYAKLLADGVQMVFVNGGAPALDVPDVAVDEQLAGYLATRHLIELGHTRVGFVSGPARSLPSRLKRAGWTAALEEAGVRADPAWVAHAPFGAEGGAEAVARLLDSGARPTAVICSSDHMALGVLREAHRRGISVPRELSVVGFDDIPMASYCAPALTTLAQPIDEMARAAVDELSQRLDPDGRRTVGGSYSRVFRPRLVVRESTAPPA
ncbi:transcriptional regulator, LacI family [Streptoalloteichus tenebrarius]|uniref:Transcriptional regulator, LacI family n=1 Tax=Streptoalloteichus tenebrarius (strain ATCC 17920 / DSM 40477 / JCM 4838 / CBS 697.72 / NBRC 16177 / NCIMB 11028 / NRRL B-12390 / A12253. 1 / ISP 5477) TaxID=1933 RepID=A0ABT1HYQ1_STRSD|nr:LacI family DNA-binding transcriptional regulator [Streptoalloteichus tenebrarius]MCP2260648.1 transcriptional regulator, LacI family [Streptoalloteichus tenebrarius]BFF01532.1 LacI family DNA-binding transcriptional regulator [Streptoalloteichus tenebrarius]